MEEKKAKSKGFNSKDVDLVSKSLKGLTDFVKTMEQVSSQSSRFRLENAMELQRMQKANKKAKSDRMKSYYRAIQDALEQTPINERNAFLNKEEYNLVKLGIQANLSNNKSYAEEVQQMVIQIIEQLRKIKDKIPYTPPKESQSLTPTINTNGFSLKNNIPLRTINKVREALVEHNFINKETTKKDFESVFRSDMKTEYVDWLTKAALKYFVTELTKHEELFPSKVTQKWKVTENCFTVNQQKINNEDMRNTSKLSKNNKKILNDILSFL